MRRILEQSGSEPICPIVGTSRPKEPPGRVARRSRLEESPEGAAWKSRLKAGGFFCRYRFRAVFCYDRGQLAHSSKRCVMSNKRVQCMARRTIVCLRCSIMVRSVG